MRNLRLEICYDGTRYRGWQRLPGTENTIQGKLEACLSRILDQPVQVIGSGRTDAGVHALGQTVNFHCESDMPAEEILSALRRYLPEDIGIRSCREVSDRFHARLSAREKTYRYRLWTGDEPCVFERKYVTVLREPLDEEEMTRAAELLTGRHDFRAFCANSHMKKSTVRTICAIRLERNGPELDISVTADGFLYNMMRILAGTLIEVGRGDRDAASIPALFGAARAEAGFLAPAQGLCLMEVIY